MERNIYRDKVKSFPLAEKVKSILQKKGYSTLFNFTDYNVFKNQCRMAFNKANAIANKFIAEAQPSQNDFQDYIF